MEIAAQLHGFAGADRGSTTFLMAAGAAATRFPLGACDSHKQRLDNLEGSTAISKLYRQGHECRAVVCHGLAARS